MLWRNPKIAHFASEILCKKGRFTIIVVENNSDPQSARDHSSSNFTLMIKHISKYLVAGIVAILPIAGTILTVVYLESSISKSGIADLPFYVPGMGLILAVGVVYLVGLLTTTLIGRWAWNRIDVLLGRLPALGSIYVSLKQILGYGEGRDAVFLGVVTVKSINEKGEEIGLITNRMVGPNGGERLVVFVPGAPNPTTGRMIMIDPSDTKPSSLSVHEALKSLVTIGKSLPSLEETSNNQAG
jgi:uncharacterized membrane protein